MTWFWILTIVFLGVSAWASWKVKSTFAEHNKVPIQSGYSGAEAAAAILRAAGVDDVRIQAVPGMLSDHYDPRQKVVALSEEVLHGRTPAAVAVAAHEVGHALQHAHGYHAMVARDALVPVTRFASGLAIPMLIAGALLHATGLIWLGVIGFSFAVLFHVVTLPVEFDASARAIRILEQSGIVQPDEMGGVRKTLYAAGFTYLAGALVALFELLHWLSLLGVFGGGDE